MKSVFKVAIIAAGLITYTLGATSSTSTSTSTSTFTYSSSVSYKNQGSDWTSKCSTGEEQSPIDIPTKSGSFHKEEMEVEIQVGPLVSRYVYDYSYTKAVTFSSGDGMMAFEHGGELTLFKLLSMNIHAPSEHTFNSERYDVEIQLVFQQYNSSQIAIVAMFLDEHEGGDKTNNFIDSMKFDKTVTTTSDFIPLQHLIDRVEKEEFYYYEGSYTLPNCTEHVEWIVFPEPLYISGTQVTLINKKWKNNSTFSGYGYGNIRKTQELHDRTIYLAHSLSYQFKAALMLLVFTIGIAYII